MSLYLVIDNNGLFRNYPYIGEYSAADNCWHGQGNSSLSFHPAQKVFDLKSIKNFQTLGKCKTYPPEHEIYLVKRFVDKHIRTLLHDKNNYTYFIASRHNDFYPFCWYVGDLWPIPKAVYCMRDEMFTRDGGILAKPTDEFICVDKILGQENTHSAVAD